MKQSRVVAVVLALSSVLACGGELAYHLGLERGVMVVSPDARHVAYVENHVSIDPPNQTLRLASTEPSLTALWDHVELRQLGEDTESCSAIAWSAESERVAFVINGARVVVYEVSTADLVHELDLVELDGYPTTRAVLDLKFHGDGSSLSYLDCRRRSGEDCQPRFVELVAQQADV